MKPVYEMTYDEWKGLSTLEISKYPKLYHKPHEWKLDKEELPLIGDRCNCYYYYVALKQHIENNATITKRIWDNLPPNWQSHLINAYTYK